jgi:predicted PurR-regulated permease PerM
MGSLEQIRTGVGSLSDAQRLSAPGSNDAVDLADPPRSPGVQGQPAQMLAGHSDADVPPSVRLASAWSWRLLTIVGALAVLFWLAYYVRLVLIPLAIALLLAALLAPAVGRLRRRARMPQTLATVLVMAGGLIVVAGTLALAITQFIAGLPVLVVSATDGIGQIQGWLETGPLHLTSHQLNGDAVQRWLEDHRGTLTSGALSTVGAATEILAGGLLALFATFFLLRDGERIWQFMVGLLPHAARMPVGRAGEESWLTLTAYVHAVILVAFIDAVGIGLALLVLGVPFAFPLAALVFLSSFIPIIGASVSGVVAVLVALVTRGPLIALIVLIAVILVQQLEGHVLQPVIMGRAVRVHPLAVIVAIATGLTVAGIVGALVAVPVIAVLNSGIRSLLHRAAAPAEQHAHSLVLRRPPTVKPRG